MFARKPLLRQLMAFGLCAAIGLGAFDIGQAPLTPQVSAATVYETKVKYGVNLRASASIRLTAVHPPSVRNLLPSARRPTVSWTLPEAIWGASNTNTESASRHS